MRCNLGVGCDEAGHCFAGYHGRPDQCGADVPHPTFVPPAARATAEACEGNAMGIEVGARVVQVVVLVDCRGCRSFQYHGTVGEFTNSGRTVLVKLDNGMVAVVAARHFREPEMHPGRRSVWAAWREGVAEVLEKSMRKSIAHALRQQVRELERQIEACAP